ncbi:CHAT domain-containing protein [Microcoleus sp. FACHB-831]|uniref:CHAT domain-containing protein n=1 Tax=Microcoleus sp. FACHB-831 TaxID=2692827 RepID=UPI001685AB4F|nr:CHAT domain-containing protein [Microcoleus sp. FACHB-831]MBD1922432.1 CHAT domain-containing protein [Microcoleus sp. FACHB-831]
MGLINWLGNLATQGQKFAGKISWRQLNLQAFTLYQQGKFYEAAVIAEQALDLAFSLYQDDHPDVATSLSNLALFYKSQGKFSEAEPKYQEALAMRQRLFEGDHPDVATSLNNLAGIYDSQGKFSEAELLFQQALAMWLRLFQGDHPDVATSLNNLAAFYDSQGKFSEAEPKYQEALAMLQRLFEGDHPNVATSLNNLASLYQSQGRYSEAEPKYQEALAMRQRLFEGDHPNVATSLNNLASLYQSQGRYSEAEPLYQQALAMLQRLFNGDHPDVATSLNNLAAFYESQGKFSEAELLFQQALAMLQRLFEGDHPDVATSLNNLAGIYDSQGRYTEAEPLYQQALAMRQCLFEGDHPDVAQSLNNLASLYDSQGRYSKAELLFQQSLAMTQRLFEDDHPQEASILNNLAGLLAATDRPTQALELIQQAAAMEGRIIRRQFAYSSERDRLTYLDTIRTTLEGLLSLVWRYLSDSPEAVQIALDVVLQRKSLSASAIAAFNYALYSGRYPHLQEEFTQLRRLQAELVHLTFDPPLPDPKVPVETYQSLRKAQQKKLAELEAQCQQLEKQLASQVPEIQLQEQECDRRAVALELPSGSTLVEFVRFNLFDFTAPEKTRWQTAQYVAFILPAQQPDAVQMIKLGKAEPIDKLIRVFREAFVKSSNSLGNRKKTKTPDADVGEKPIQQISDPNADVGEKLRQQIFDSILSELRTQVSEVSKHFFIAPDGNLNLLPFQILPMPETDKLLMDEYTISYLSVGRDILRRKVETNRPVSDALIIANPDFNLSVSSKDFSHSSPRSQVQPGNAFREVLPPQLSALSSTFEAVPETGFLGERVAEKLGVKPYLQQEALEPILTSSKCPRLLMIATHGYFAEENQPAYLNLIAQLLNCADGEEREILQKHPQLLDEKLPEIMADVTTYLAANDDENSANWLRNFAKQLPEIINKINPNNSETHRFTTTLVENPMMRSGLAFAGAETWLKGGKLPPEAGKGFLFAQDIISIDLWDNEIAILVACETAIGDIKNGEGVFGLRRAFAVAGTKTLVMSLWSVPVKATVLLMERFFDNLQGGLRRVDALQEAQNYIRRITIEELQQFPLGCEVIDELLTLKLLPKNQLSCQEFRLLEHPFFWGAWVCQGEITNQDLRRHTTYSVPNKGDRV